MDLTPLEWHRVGKAYLDAAEELVASRIELDFEEPIRALFAHAWEMNLKACLRCQGMTVIVVRRKFGHDLMALWNATDRAKFPLLDLRDELGSFINRLSVSHSKRLYSYPRQEFKNEHGLSYLRAASSRLRLTRSEAVKTFGSP